MFIFQNSLPGDPKVIDGILDAFSKAYCATNPDVMKDPALMLKLVFALIMLNVDLHRQQSMNHLSLKDFIDRFREHDPDGIVSDQLMKEMYESISTEKLAVASITNSESYQEKIVIRFSHIPFRISIKDVTPEIRISIPAPDPGLQIRIVTPKGLTATPEVVDFIKSNHATYQLSGSSLGKKNIAFLKYGVSSPRYDSNSIPQHKSIIIEPSFMKYCFQLKEKVRDPVSKKKTSYMFSVANER